LVAFTILSMVVAIAGSSMAVSFKQWQSQGRAVHEIQTQTAVLETLREQVQGALPIRYTTSISGETSLAFTGDSRELRFISRAGFQDGANGVPRWIRISWDSPQFSQAGRIVVEERRLLQGNIPDGTISWRQPVIAADDFHIEYLESRRSGRPAAWLPSWNSLDSRLLPAGVRIRFVAPGRGPAALVMKLDYAESNAQGFWLP
jgi:hypothetical protein